MGTRFCLTVGCLLSAALLPAGQEPEGRKLTLQVTDLSVNYNRTTKKAKIVLKGTTKNFPAGVKITLKLLYNYHEITTGTTKVRPDATVEPVTFAPAIPLPPDDVYEVDMEVTPENQEPSLKKAVEALLAESVYDPIVKTFSVGSAEEKKRDHAEVKKYIKKLLDQVVALNNEFITEVEQAEKKLKYVTGDALDTKAWRHFVDELWRPKCIKLQKEFASWRKRNPAYQYRYGAGVVHFEEMLRTVAWRSVYRSRRLYTLFKKKLVPEDLSPPSSMRMRPAYARVSSDSRALKYLGKCYRVVREAFGLVPQKPPAVKKEKESPGTGEGSKPAEKKGS